MAVTTDGAQTEPKTELALEVAELFPPQGQWAEDHYFSLPETIRYIELSQGRLIMPPHPTSTHQRVVLKLALALEAFVSERQLGTVHIAPLPVRLWPDKIREPDLLFMSAAHADRIHEQYLDAPDLVMEVTSPGTRGVDRVEKLYEYARAGVAEYWLVDPEAGSIEAYSLRGKDYDLVDRWTGDGIARSVLIEGFEIQVRVLFAAQ